DHFSPQDVERLSGEGTTLVAPAPVAERLTGQVRSIAPGEALELGRIDVRAIAAYNTSKRDPSGNLFHPRESGWVGYELRIGGERLYHSGDTDVIPEMDEVAGVDVALLAVSGVYVMTPGEAAEAARRIQPALAVPMHWGEHIGTRADAEAFADRAPVEVRILEKATD
ncbi:MAG: MBL fold metallo-hydrolase, partial [Actinobacteria bacterium]